MLAGPWSTCCKPVTIFDVSSSEVSRETVLKVKESLRTLEYDSWETTVGSQGVVLHSHDEASQHFSTQTPVIS